MDIGAIFVRASDHLYWKRIEDDHAFQSSSGEPINNDEHYFVIRMREMFVRNTRVLWRKYYPLLHGFTTYRNTTEHAIAGPGQLRELGEAGLDRIVNLNYPLTPPMAYVGGDLALLVGLYSIPGQDAAKALIGFVGSLTALGGVATAQIPQIADTIKQGIDSVLGLGDTKLQIGVRDTFFTGNPLRSGFHVGIAAAVKDVPIEHLWVKDGHLIVGEDPVSGQPYEEYDYFLLGIERHDHFDAWAGLPGISDYEATFNAILGDGALGTDAKRTKLWEIWPAFANAIDSSKHLVRPDRENIKKSVSTNLLERLKAMQLGNPFETKSWTTKETKRKRPEDFDYLDVEVTTGALGAGVNPFA